MELEELVPSGTRVMVGSDSINVPSDHYFRIQFGEAGSIQTLLQEQVPSGKSWEVNVSISVNES